MLAIYDVETSAVMVSSCHPSSTPLPVNPFSSSVDDEATLGHYTLGKLDA